MEQAASMDRSFSHSRKGRARMTNQVAPAHAVMPAAPVTESKCRQDARESCDTPAVQSVWHDVRSPWLFLLCMHLLRFNRRGVFYTKYTRVTHGRMLVATVCMFPCLVWSGGCRLVAAAGRALVSDSADVSAKTLFNGTILSRAADNLCAKVFVWANSKNFQKCFKGLTFESHMEQSIYYENVLPNLRAIFTANKFTRHHDAFCRDVLRHLFEKPTLTPSEVVHIINAILDRPRVDRACGARYAS